MASPHIRPKWMGPCHLLHLHPRSALGSGKSQVRKPLKNMQAGITTEGAPKAELSE